jgi:hypothetical protein
MLKFHDDSEPLIKNLVHRPMGQAPHDEIVDLAILPRVTLESDGGRLKRVIRALV